MQSDDRSCRSLLTGVSSAPCCAPALLCRGRLRGAPFVDLLESCCQHLELLLPILGIAIQPHGCIEERTHIEAASADTPAALLLYQSGSHQNLNVTRHALERDIKE